MNLTSIEVSIDRGKLVLAMFLNKELFWMNNKTIIEFDFRIIWKIMEISISIILHKILNLIH